MLFLRPTATALQQLEVADITPADFPGFSGLLQKSVLRVLATAIAEDQSSR